MASSTCQQELCPNWTGDGRACACALLGLDPAALDLGNPRGWTPEEIRQREEASAALEAATEDDDEPLPMAKCGCCVDSPSLPEPKVIKKLKCYSDDELAMLRAKAVAANDREWCSIMDTAGVRPDGQSFDEAVLAAIRARAVEQFTAALLTGLDDLERDDHWGTLVRPGDVADLVHRVAAEVRGG